MNQQTEFGSLQNKMIRFVDACSPFVWSKQVIKKSREPKQLIHMVFNILCSVCVKEFFVPQLGGFELFCNVQVAQR